MLITQIEESYEQELALVRLELQRTSSEISLFRDQLSSLSLSSTSHSLSSPGPLPPRAFSPTKFAPSSSSSSPLLPHEQTEEDNQIFSNTPEIPNNSFNHTFSNSAHKELENNSNNFSPKDNNNNINTFRTKELHNNSSPTPLYATTPIPKSQLPLRNPRPLSSTLPSSSSSSSRASPLSLLRTRPLSSTSSSLSSSSSSSAQKVDTLVLAVKEKFALSNIVVPLEKVGDSLYKLGPRRLHLSAVKNRLVVRTSAGGFEDFFNYLAKMDTSSFRHLTHD